jgi:CDP-glycerol glycerophosphotransferase
MSALTIVVDDEASAASVRTHDDVLTATDRNAALEQAGGEYIWFVEPGDIVLPGALERVTARLGARPDVLIVHHATIDLTGRMHEGPHRKLLTRLADGVHTLAERPGLADTAPRIWNKVLRREHISGRFTAGELTVTWPALLQARRIATLPHASYVHIQQGEGSPFAVFEQYEQVLASADPALVVPAMVRHQLRLLRRLPATERREFFHRMSEQLRRHSTGNERLARLIERDAYFAFQAVEKARGRRGAVRRFRRRTVASARKRSLERHYRERLKQPVDPKLAVYGAYWFRGYSCNPRAIYERARELAPDVHGVWVVRPGTSMPPGVDHVVAHTPEYFDVIARAGTFVNNVNFPDHLVKREGTVHVQTHHGTPLKPMGLDLKGTPVAGRRMNFEALHERVARWDFSISQNAYTTPIWERVYPGRYESLEIGYPRNDVLATATGDDVRRAREELGIEPGQTAVLYAPTHREYQPGYVPVLDLARVADALGDDHVVLARLHYFYDAEPLRRAGRIRDVASHPSIEALCLAADVLVTDYSSIMFDYAVLDRPIVIHAPDWEIYRALRGAYFDLPTEGPGVMTRTEDELVEAITARPELRAGFRARFAGLDDGRAAERVVRRLWLSDRQPALA